MADISRYPLVRHLRSEPMLHTLRFRRGKLVKEGRGLSFWFRPLTTGVAEVPVDDRETSLLFHARTDDFQDVTVQGVVTYHVVDPALVADRIDFTIDLDTGAWNKTPLEQLAGLLTQLAEQETLDLIAGMELRTAVRDGVTAVRSRITERLTADPTLEALGIEVVAVRVGSVAPTAEVQRALEVPVQESIQQRADEAQFARRAMAVDKERAIAENELANKLELARREERLISQQGANERQRVRERAAAMEIEAEAAARRERLATDAEAEGVRTLGTARAVAERETTDIYRDLPVQVLLGLAARDLAGNLERIDHLNLAPDSIGPLLSSLLLAGTRSLDAGTADGADQPAMTRSGPAGATPSVGHEPPTDGVADLDRPE